MLVSCPKCKVSYAIEPELIPEDGKKLRCAKCGEVWLCKPEDLFELPPKQEKPSDSDNLEEDSISDSLPVIENAQEAVEEVQVDAVEEQMPEPKVDVAEEKGDMKEIFARLSQQTEKIFATEQSRPKHKKFWVKVKFSLGLQHKSRQLYLAGILFMLFLLLMFYVRFDLVRYFPAVEKFYSSVGIVSRITGEGLEFQNVVRNEYEEDYVRKLEIKGFLANTMSNSLNIPMIHVELMDKDANIIYVSDETAPLKRLGSGGRMAFRIVITKPALNTKYIYLTLVDQKK